MIIAHKEERKDRYSTREFYQESRFRKEAHVTFGTFFSEPGASSNASQGNDPFLSEVFYGLMANVHDESILPEDLFMSSISIDTGGLVNTGRSDSEVFSFRELNTKSK